MEWRRLGAAALLVAVTALLILSLGRTPPRPEAPPPVSPRLAVLPFTRVPGLESDPLRDGLMDDLIDGLARRYPDRLSVVARTSAMTRSGTGKPPREVGRELGASHLLSGTIRQDADRTVVEARLLRAADEAEVWRQTLEVRSEEMPRLGPLLIDGVARALGLGEGAPVPTFAGLTPRAFQAFTEGRYLARKGTPEDRQRALALLQEAILLAPDFAPAYIACGWTRLDFSRPAGEVVPGAEAAARKALELDPRSGEARAILANIELFFRFDWRRARAELDQALALSPGDPEPHRVHAAYLASQGHLDAALLAARRAQLLDPFSDVVQGDLAWYLFLDRRYGEALDATRQTLALQPGDPWARSFLIDAALAAGEPQTALAQANSLLAGLQTRALSPPPPVRVETLRDFWQWQVQRLETGAARRPISPLASTIPLLHLGDQERVLRLLAEARRARFGSGLVFLAVDPRFDPLHKRPEFQAILRSLGLAP